MIRDNWLSIRHRMERAAESVGRTASQITLVAITKGIELDRIEQAYEVGIRDFGESRLQEALPKIASLPKDIRWHFVGNLQSNKAKRITEHFRSVHSFDNERQILALAGFNGTVDAFLEVNIAEELQKGGVLPDALDEIVQQAIYCPQVRLRGLMTVGPMVLNAEAMRPYFRKLKDLLKKVPDGSWLSMGMSGDYEVAIQEGSTHIRVGSALFGERK